MTAEERGMVDVVTARQQVEDAARAHGHVLGAWFGSDNVCCTACGHIAWVAWDGSLHGPVVRGRCPEVLAAEAEVERR